MSTLHYLFVDTALFFCCYVLFTLLLLLLQGALEGVLEEVYACLRPVCTIVNVCTDNRVYEPFLVMGYRLSPESIQYTISVTDVKIAF